MGKVPRWFDRGAEAETPKSSRAGNGQWFSVPNRLRSLGSGVSSHSWVRGKTLDENGFQCLLPFVEMFVVN